MSGSNRAAALLQESAKSILPRTQPHSIGVKAGRRQCGIMRAASGAGRLICSDGQNGNCLATGAQENLSSEIKPGTYSFICDVRDPTRIFPHQIANCTGKITGVGG